LNQKHVDLISIKYMGWVEMKIENGSVKAECNGKSDSSNEKKSHFYRFKYVYGFF